MENEFDHGLVGLEDQDQLNDAFFQGGEGGNLSGHPIVLPDNQSLILTKAHAPPPVSEASTRSNLSLSLNTELRAIAASNPKFEACPPHRIFETANYLIANGITTAEAFRTTDEIDRRYLFEDLRNKRQA